VRLLTDDPPSDGPTSTSILFSSAMVVRAKFDDRTGVDGPSCSTLTWNNRSLDAELESTYCSDGDAELLGNGRSGGPNESACICVGLGMNVGLSGGEGGAVSVGRSPCLLRLGVEGSLLSVIVMPVELRM
jgi:hypothetical protein